ncbi:MAG: histidinol-phosphatase [Verrucomicrobiales bacterium]
MTADYHLHTPLCGHATGSCLEYARAAIARGLAEIGFSDHSPMPRAFDDWRMKIEDLPRYVAMVEEAREATRGDLEIKLGLEVDFFADGRDWIEDLGTRAPFDYLIGSVHYIAPGWAVDDPDPKWIGKWTGQASVEEIWSAYWELYASCAGSGLFDILAHPDLPKKFGHRPAGDLRHYYQPTIEAAARTGVAFELSTAGLRKQCAEMYPARPFLEMALEAGLPLVISSDAHAPSEVGADFETAIALAREVGFTHSARFSKRERTMVKL